MNSATLNTTRVSPLANLSLVSIMMLGVITSAHHLYRFGLSMLIPAIVVVFLPYVLFVWFQRSNRKLALWAYGFFAALTIGWLGIVDGGLDHTLVALNRYVLEPLGVSWFVVDLRLLPPSPLVGDLVYEGTGILSFAASLVAAYYCYQFIREARRPASGRTGQS